MSPLSEQFSQARKLQLETQLNFFRNFTGKAVESTEKLLALNLGTSRASLDQSSNLVRQLMSAKDPRDLFALTSQTQSQFNSVLAYSRQLFGIAAGAATAAVPAAVSALPSAAALAAPVPVLELVPAPPAAVAVAVDLVPEPTLAAVANSVREAAPIAQPTPLAKAVGNLEVQMPSTASFPVPSSAQPIAVASVKPVEAKPPAAPASGTPSIVTAKAQAPGAKAARKK